MPVRRIASLVLTTIVVAACGPVRVFPPPAPTPTQEWTIRLAQTGGFAGVNFVVEVSSEGKLTAEDMRVGRSASRVASEADIEELRRLIAEAGLQGSQRLTSPCADCFIYDLEIDIAGQLVELQADDMTLDASGARELIEMMLRLRDQALRSGA